MARARDCKGCHNYDLADGGCEYEGTAELPPCACRALRRVARLEGLIAGNWEEDSGPWFALEDERDRILARRQREKGRRG